MTQLTEKEKVIIERLEKYLFENSCSFDMAVSMLKLIMEYNAMGSAKHLSTQRCVTPQYINRTCKYVEVSGVRFYFSDL